LVAAYKVGLSKAQDLEIYQDPDGMSRHDGDLSCKARRLRNHVGYIV
jgi:hypothetical protein